MIDRRSLLKSLAGLGAALTALAKRPPAEAAEPEPMTVFETRLRHPLPPYGQYLWLEDGDVLREDDWVFLTDASDGTQHFLRITGATGRVAQLRGPYGGYASVPAGSRVRVVERMMSVNTAFTL